MSNLPTLSAKARQREKEKEMIKKLIKLTNVDIVACLGIGFIIGLLVGSILYQTAQAEERITHIGIEWSETCLSLIELGDLETCGNPDLIKLSYQQNPLKPNYQLMFDNMAKGDKAEYQQRNILNNHIKSCMKEDYCNVFKEEKYRQTVYYWFDLPNEARGYLDKIITINSHMKHTNLNVINDEVFVFENSRNLILDTNQINIKYCHKITYTPGNDTLTQLREMGYIMWHILDDCKDNAKLGILNAPYIEELELTVIPVDESPAWLELQRLEGLKAKYKENMIGKD